MSKSTPWDPNGPVYFYYIDPMWAAWVPNVGPGNRRRAARQRRTPDGGRRTADGPAAADSGQRTADSGQPTAGGNTGLLPGFWIPGLLPLGSARNFV